MKDINPPPKARVPTGRGKLIQDVNTGKQLEFDRSGIVGFLKSLNPLQFASETIAQLAHYKLQVKLLETEQIRINAEAGIRHHQIDAALQAGLRLLDERRCALQMALDAVTRDLENTHLERKRVIDCITGLVSNISDPRLSSEEKQYSHATISLLTEVLKTMGEQSTVRLDLIAKNTQKALEAMPRSDRLLTFAEE